MVLMNIYRTFFLVHQNCIFSKFKIHHDLINQSNRDQRDLIKQGVYQSEPRPHHTILYFR